ncbi:hypothetical protein [Halobellus rufus]|uniref:hypothetical protein n=1 Tax=Halobellus rufus TaxID=1448860 RepID=UPI0012E07EB9|nr:hypothetical protein [Halobellus rufus]
MLSGQFVPMSATFVGLALVTSGVGHTGLTRLSLARTHQLVFLFLLSGTISLAL